MRGRSEPVPVNRLVISLFGDIAVGEARKLIVLQSSQTYAQVTKPTAVSTTTQTDPNIYNIICSPLQCLISAYPMQIRCQITLLQCLQSPHLPFTSSVIPTLQNESQFNIPISSTTTSPGNSLNTPALSLSTETRLFPTTSNKFAELSTEIQPPQGAHLL
ncbi:hypothetical protein TNCV_2315911 [Trichonephila clavipes]|nr:hypothetical protein TNCV_2315911 [Trichonephila clavipes]